MRSRRFAALAVGLSLTVSTPALAAGDYVLRMTPQDKATILDSRKDPATAAVLGIVPGAGHIYGGNWQRGAVIAGTGLGLIIGLVIINGIAGQKTPVDNDPNGIAAPLSMLAFALFDVWNMRDAFYTTEALNTNREEMARGTQLPKPDQF
jgi:hypothetical protein